MKIIPIMLLQMVTVGKTYKLLVLTELYHRFQSSDLVQFSMELFLFRHCVTF